MIPRSNLDMHNLVVYNCIHKIARRILEDGSYYSTDTPARYRNGSPSRKIYSNAIDIDPSQLPPPWKRELENRFAKTVSLTFSLSLSFSLDFEGAARWHEILLKDVDNQRETRVSSRAERVFRGIGVVDSRTRHVYGWVKCKTSERKGIFYRGMRFIESFLARDFVISLARCAAISVFRLDERWFDILMLTRFDLVGKGDRGGIKMLGKRVLLL